jgi:hypothetical protein
MERYYRRRWEEPRGDAHDEWGPSTWFFEVVDGHATRQIERYDNGPTLVYDAEHDDGEYGHLTYAEFDVEEWAAFEIDAATFEREGLSDR